MDNITSLQISDGKLGAGGGAARSRPTPLCCSTSSCSTSN